MSGIPLILTMIFAMLVTLVILLAVVGVAVVAYAVWVGWVVPRWEDCQARREESRP